MRQGQNPLRNQMAPAGYKPIVFVVVTHLPEENVPGYHSQRMEVVQACLSSMHYHAKIDHTFMVWDNGSRKEFRDWLQYTFKPDILVLSKNIGKTAARASAIQSLPLGSIVCYSDDDILYSDNWLKPQLELLNVFPNVAVVSGYPIRTMFRWGVENTINWARKNARLEQGRFIPKEWEIDYCESVGQDYDQYVQKTIKDTDYRITYDGHKAYATSHHCQFVAYAVRILPALIFDETAMGDEKPFDIQLDQIGLRLCTIERLTKHIGNVLDEKLKEEMLVIKS